MGQPYSCLEDVLGGARWDRGKFLESHLHVYGMDGMKEVVYKLKEEPEEGIERKRKEEHTRRKEGRTEKEKKRGTQSEEETLEPFPKS